VLTIRGRVLDSATGVGVAFAHILASVDGAQGDRQFVEVVTSDSAEYELELPGSEALLLEVRAPNYALYRDGFEVEGPEHRHDIQLEAGFSVALLVVDEQNSPVEGAQVSAILHDEAAGSCAWPLVEMGRRERQHKTGADGRIQLDGFKSVLPYGERYVLAISHPDRVEVLINRPDTLPRSEGVALVAVTLLQGHALDVVIQVPEGETPTTATILALFQEPSGVNPPCHAIVREGRPDASGRARLPGLAAGRYVLRVEHPNLLKQCVPFDFDPSSKEPATISLLRGRCLTGEVRGERNAQILLEWKTGYQTLTTGDNGEFSTAAVPVDEEVLIVATAADAVPGRELLGAQRLAASSEPVTLAFSRDAHAVLTGQAVDAETSEPLTLQLMIDGVQTEARGQFRSNFDAKDGRFELHLPPGDYELGVRAIAGWEERYAKLERIQVTAGSARHVTLRLPRTFDVEVLVANEAGQPLAYAAVMVDPRSLWARFFEAHTNAAGRATLTTIFADTGRLRVAADGYEPVTREIDFKVERGPLHVTLSRQAI
jgi:hypothetical protein